MNTQQVLEQLSKRESRRIFASLLRVLGDFDLAEEALQEAFRIALEKWPRQGVPQNPVSWLISAGRFRAIDALRRQSRHQPFDQEVAVEDELEEFPDDRLSLIFTCCHPSLAEETQVALTLREVVGLETAEIARAFLMPLATLAQRLVGLYDRLLQIEPSPIVQLNRAMAISHLLGPQSGLKELPELPDDPLWHAARADLLHRLGEQALAAQAYRCAISLTQDVKQARFWEVRVAKLGC